MRVSAAGFTLLGLGLLAATGCQSSAGSYASSRPSWHWPWSKKPAMAESDIAQSQQANPYPQLPSQMAQSPPAGSYNPNYYGTTTGTDPYAQNPAGYPPQQGYAAQPAGYGAQPTSYGAQPTGYGSAPASQSLYDQTQPAAVAQTGAYPLNQAGSYAQPNAGYGDPSAAAVNNDYYNSDYARQDATGYAAAAAPATGNGYGQVDPSQPTMGYETQAGAAMSANPAMPQVGYPNAQVADARGAAGMPAPQASPPAANDPNYAAPGSAYAPVAPQSPSGWADPSAASTSAGNYNEPDGFQPNVNGYSPSANGYTPGTNGFQPAGTTPYQSPAGSYNTNPNAPSGGRYRPGSTGDYYPSGASNAPPAGGGQMSSSGSAVAPANYNAVRGAASAEVPAIYNPSAIEAAANSCNDCQY